MSATKDTATFEGTNSAGQDFFNNLKRPYFDVNESKKFQNDTTTAQVTTKINLLKNAELDTVQNMMEAKKIDFEFAKVLKKEIDYFYAQRTAEIITVKQYGKKPIPEELLVLFDKTVAKYPLNSRYKPSSWNRYAEIVLQEKAVYDAITDGIVTKDSLQSYYLKDKTHPFYYDLVHSYKDAEVAEKVAAIYIINKAKQNKFEKSLISVYEQFQKDFPNSIYTPYLTADIEKIKEYYVKISGEMPANVHFYENGEIGSLKEMLPDLKGEKYYVDVWATWCGPCKREFIHNKALNALLKEKGYKKLYISLDKEAQRKKWKQDIKYFELGGLHLLASKEFFADFEKNHSKYNGYIGIPQYLLINDGVIVTNDAPRPSDLKKLRTILEE